jgi:hypothetical protein
VVLRIEDDELRISTIARRIARIQTLMRRHNKAGEKLSECLIRDRRAEAAKE